MGGIGTKNASILRKTVLSRRNIKINVTETGWAFVFKVGIGKERLVGNELREVNRD